MPLAIIPAPRLAPTEADPDTGISFAEFTCVLLHDCDFAYLARRDGCE